MIAKIDGWNYEATVARVEDILEAIEGGELGLIEVFEQLEVVAVDMRRCEDFLAQHQESVDLVVETLGE